MAKELGIDISDGEKAVLMTLTGDFGVNVQPDGLRGYTWR